MLQAPENGDARLDERVEALASWVDEIAERVRAAELASGDERTAKELRRAIEAVAKHDPKLESRLTDRIDVVLDRLGTLASAVSTTSAELARRDGEIAAVRRELDQASVRVEALGRDVSNAASVADVAKLREAIAERSPERPVRREDERLDRIEGRLALLAERIDTLAPTVTTATAGLAARDGELANLRRKLDQVLAELRADPRAAALSGRVDTLATELEASTAKLARRDEDVEALRIRIDDAYAKADAVISELQLSLATVSSRLRTIEELPEKVEQVLDATRKIHQFEGLRAEVQTRLDAVESDRVLMATEIDRGAKALAAGRAAVQVQLDELTASLARVERSKTSDESERRLGELASRLDAMADDLATVQAIVSRESSIERSTEGNESDRRLAELAARLDALAAEVARTTSAKADHESAVPALRARIDETYGKSSAVISELQLSLGALLSRVGALEELPERVEQTLQAHVSDIGTRMSRLDDLSSEHADLLADLGARIARANQGREGARDEIDRILDVWASDRSSLETRIDEIGATGERARSLVDDLQLRLASSEREVADLHRTPNLSSQLADITDRLDAIERNAHGVVVSSDAPAAGDGRFRLELRALELRVEQAEKSASQDRDAFLVHLERLTSRIEWRLQGLESEGADPSRDDPTPTGAQVVPFRGVEV